MNFQDGCVLLLNDGMRASDPKFIDLNSINDGLPDLDEDETKLNDN
jgi:hypothetical protein